MVVLLNAKSSPCYQYTRPPLEAWTNRDRLDFSCSDGQSQENHCYSNNVSIGPVSLTQPLKASVYLRPSGAVGSLPII